MTLDMVLVDTKTMASPARVKVEVTDTAMPMLDMILMPTTMAIMTLDGTVDTKASLERDHLVEAGDLASLARDHQVEAGVRASLVRDHPEEAGVRASLARDHPTEEAGDILEETLVNQARDHPEEAGVDMAIQVRMETTMVTPMDHTAP